MSLDTEGRKMKKIVMFMILGTLALVACPDGNRCNSHQKMGCQGYYKGGNVLATLNDALEEMGRADDADIKLAIHSYKMGLASSQGGVNTEAFKGGSFDKELYMKESRLQLKLQAQVDLFETIYLVLNAKEKKQLYTLMRAYQVKEGTAGRIMHKQMCPSKTNLPQMCPKKESACSHCKTKCQCENSEECKCKHSCDCAKCKVKRER